VKVCWHEGRTKRSRGRKTGTTIGKDGQGVVQEGSGAKSIRAASSAKLVLPSDPGALPEQLSPPSRVPNSRRKTGLD